jgi:hypothetical protein
MYPLDITSNNPIGHDVFFLRKKVTISSTEKKQETCYFLMDARRRLNVLGWPTHSRCMQISGLCFNSGCRMIGCLWFGAGKTWPATADTMISRSIEKLTQ